MFPEHGTTGQLSVGLKQMSTKPQQCIALELAFLM